MRKDVYFCPAAAAPGKIGGPYGVKSTDKIHGENGKSESERQTLLVARLLRGSSGQGGGSSFPLCYFCELHCYPAGRNLFLNGSR